MDFRTHEYKLCMTCGDYTEHWKELGRPEWNCAVCGTAFDPNKTKRR